jgi:hypothetical protein
MVCRLNHCLARCHQVIVTVASQGDKIAKLGSQLAAACIGEDNALGILNFSADSL